MACISHREGLSLDLALNPPQMGTPERPSSMSRVEELFNTVQKRPATRPRAFSDSSISSSKTRYTARRFSLFASVPKSEITQAQATGLLQKLQRENMALRNENTYLKFEAQIREEELSRFRSKYYTEKFNAAAQKHVFGSKYAPSEFSTANPASSGASLTSPLLHLPTLRVAATSNPSEPPLSSLPRSVPHLLSPNSYSGSSVSDTVARESQGAKRAVLLRADKSKHILSSPSPHNMSRQGERTMNSSKFQQQRTSALPIPSGAPSSHTPDASQDRPPRNIIHTHKQANERLAPLASQAFKDEVRGRLPVPKRPHQTQTQVKSFRPVLNEVDTNRARGPSVRSVENPGTQQTAKAMGKRRAIVLKRTPLDYKSIGSCNLKEPAKLDASPPCPLESHYLPPPTPFGSVTDQLDDHETLSTGKALLSLERICAGFSSGDLGSLSSSSDLLMTKDALNDIPSLFVVDTAGDSNNMLTESPSFSPQSVKTSTPLISRFRPSLFSPSQFRPTATSSPKDRSLRPRVHFSPMRPTKPTGCIMSTPSPAKKSVSQYISPLRITKKGKDMFV